MEKITITKLQARHFLLSYQHLWPPYELTGKSGVLDYIRRVNCIQFDPLNIVGHNHELVLQSRVSDFRPFMLAELLYKDRKLIDGWDKNMSIYCVEDWPYFERNREAARQKLGDSNRPAVSILPQVRDEISKRGPLSSTDLNYDQTVNWAWAPTRLSRAALESMYFWGELIVHHKVHTRKLYDFASRHIPQELLNAPDPNKTGEQYHDWYVLRRIGSIGLLWNRSGGAWLGVSGLKTEERSTAFLRLKSRGEIVEVSVEGLEQPLYMKSEDRPYLHKILQGKNSPGGAAVIAPLDNLLWDRELAKRLFDFDYKWEVYKPAAERLYGYYVLPVLCGDRFVARFEPGRDRNTGVLIIKNWWWEPGVSQTGKMQSALKQCFKHFTSFLGAQSIQLDSKIQEREGLEWLTS